MGRTISSSSRLCTVESAARARFLMKGEVVMINQVVALTVREVYPSKSQDLVLVDGTDATGHPMSHVYQGLDSWAQLQGELVAL